MRNAATKNVSSRASLPILVLLGILCAAAAAGQDATWANLFEAQCTGVGGCKADCLNHATTPAYCNQCGQNCFNCGSACSVGCPGNCNACDPTYCACAQSSSGQWFQINASNPAVGTPNIQITAAPANVTYCRTVTTQSTCQFSVGSGGVTQISFDFAVSAGCTVANSSQPAVEAGTEWLAFWIVNANTVPTGEVDFIESRFGPGAGLNTNFDGQGNQAVIYSTGSPWSGSITATFSGSGNSVGAQVQAKNSQGQVLSNGSSTLSQSSGYFFLMDTAGGSKNSACTIAVSNLAIVGSVPSTVNGNPNCANLPGASGSLAKGASVNGSRS